MSSDFVTGVGRIVDLVGALSGVALVAVFVVGILVCYFVPESMASSYAALFFSIIAGMRAYASTHSASWTILAFVLAGGVLTFISFIGNVKHGTIQTAPPSRSKGAATEGLPNREWFTYSSPQHDFCVDLPYPPEVSHESGGTSLFTTYTSGNDVGEVRVEVTEYPKDFVDRYGPRKLLEQLPKVYGKSWNIISFDNSSEFLGYPAALVELQRDKGAVAANLVCVFRDCSEYGLLAETWDEPDNLQTARTLSRKLVESFQFLEGSRRARHVGPAESDGALAQ